ncbi:MAG: cytochrome c3 family protein [Kofleriaceae bacterium]|nr:cytochrome c3 family protein [Myxococcales bacterium]MCB9565486.1 cytochrome c3 family protein [Kofleriaceae bacterium]MCB9570973.1 cytochrome c3 family protein [Kofleriaceae bacterium]
MTTQRHRSLRRLATLVVALSALAAPRAARGDGGPAACLTCHDDAVHADRYGASAHKDLACTACHLADAAVPPPSRGDQQCVASFTDTECARCHGEEAEAYRGSVHDGARLPVACATCHADIHAIRPHQGDKLRAAETCAGCHDRQQPYFESVHYTALAAGNDDAPTCTDCHGVHAIARVDNDAAGRVFHTRACLTCHDDRAMMARNDVTPVAGETYFRSFHGKNVDLGYPEQVAGCADCHTAHDVRPADDPASSVNPAHLVETCSQCHAGATASFAKYQPHADDHDRGRYPALYWTRLAMTGLLIGTFLFFWAHSLLWAVRAFVDKQRRARAGAPHATAPATGGRIFRRFTGTQIAMHVVVVVSFLTLALTGLPLKFHDTPWARAVMDAIGGPGRARFFHHAAAVVTFGYFAVALAMSVAFLRRKGGRGVLDRLLGADSLFPNRRDWRDFKAMVRWFLFRGPKPTFDRWTYWEKFDFLAVFWGMFAIGASGLMLWFPEAFARVLPGWMFNVATIVHSDEALLATGFIFTVHFFNTHFRPEKFPMDTVIFDGTLDEDEMRQERGDQLRRYEAEGRLDELVVTRPTSLARALILRVFGLLALVTGLALAAGILYGLVVGGLG